MIKWLHIGKGSDREKYARTRTAERSRLGARLPTVPRKAPVSRGAEMLRRLVPVTDFECAPHGA